MAKKKILATEEDSFVLRMGEFSQVLLALAEEKGLPKEKVIEVIEAAIAAAYKKDFGERGQNIRAEFDPVAKAARYYLIKEVVDTTTRSFPKPGEEGDDAEVSEVVAPAVEGEEGEVVLPRYSAMRDILLEDAQKINPEAVVGGNVEMELESKMEFGRVAAQTAKQVIIQRLRDAEREIMFEAFKEKEGEIVNGTVQRLEGRSVYIDLGKSLGVLLPSEQIPSERYYIGQHLKVYLARVESEERGPGLALSRAHPDMVRRLFELEVPEIYNGIVQIKALAREAGSRTKMAVTTAEVGVDPIGSCVGQRGTRVQAVIDELSGEKIDIIEWQENALDFIRTALAPAEVGSVEINEEEKRAKVFVASDQLSLAIGRRGQNVRLASKLTGYMLDIAVDESLPLTRDVEPQAEGAVEVATPEVAPEAPAAEVAADTTEASADASPEKAAE